MGGLATQTFTEVRNFNTNITQASTQSCTIVCKTAFNNNNIIMIGGSGSLNVIQTCQITDSNCQLKTAFTADITNLIKTSVKQSESAMGGVSFTFNSQDQAINISSTVNNSISQIMSSTCKIANDTEANDNYIVAIGRSGDINFTQKGSITSSNCTMDNVAKASAFNKAVTDASQTSKIQSVFTLIFVAFIVLILTVGIVLITFVVTAGKVVTAGVGIVGDNPDLFM
jgi:hypothetical protein